MMKGFFNSLKSILIDVKIYVARTMSWINVANSLMLVFLVIERLNSLGIIEGDLGNSIIFVVITWFCLLVFFGWLEVKKIKAPHLESIKMIEFNVPMKNVCIGVKEIDERTKRIEEQLKKLNQNETS